MHTDHEQPTVIQEVMAAPQGMVTPSTPLPAVKRRLEGETRRSLLVVADDRPVGVVRWRDVSMVADATQTVADVMLSEVVVVTPATSLAAAREQIRDVDLDLIPVVDAAGRLVGEVPRARLLAGAEREPVIGAEAIAVPDPLARQAVLVERGTPVVGADGHQIGTVEEVTRDDAGQIAHLSVKQGFLFKHRKRLASELVAAIDPDRVVLAVTSEDVKRLPDR